MILKSIAMVMASAAIAFLGGCLKPGDGLGLDASGNALTFCQSHPGDPSCVVVNPCIANPSGPGCPVDTCKANPTAPGCSVDICVTDPAHPSCNPPVKVKFSALLPIFKEQCEQCHSPGGSGYLSGRLNLVADSAYANLVGKPAWMQALAKDWVRVKPGHPDSSILFLKVSMSTPKLPDGKVYGAAMPLYRPALSVASVDVIRKWIEDGAQP